MAPFFNGLGDGFVDVLGEGLADPEGRALAVALGRSTGLGDGVCTCGWAVAAANGDMDGDGAGD